MKKLSIYLENCFGIGKLEKCEFCFDNNKKAYSIYAPNGAMKTSFLKVFKLIKQDKKGEIKDQIYPERKSVCEIKSNDIDISKENIFSIDSYDPSFNADDKASTLLANKDLREEYQKAIKLINEKKNILDRKLKTLSRIEAEKEIRECFNLTNNDNIYTFYSDQMSQLSLAEGKFAQIVYKDIFNRDTNRIFEDGTIRKELENYINAFNEMIQKSPILRRDFNYYNLKTIKDELSKHKFFEAKHSISFFHEFENEYLPSIDNLEDLNQQIEKEKQQILKDPLIQSKIDEIQNKLTTAGLREFRQYLLNKPEILSELGDYQNFQRTLWRDYFYSSKEQLQDLINTYTEKKAEIKIILKKAQDGKTKWEEIVKSFNNRFKVPFEVTVSNESDAVLGISSPVFNFHFDDERGDEPSKQNKEDLKEKILSNGEKKALYILDLLYEIEERKLKQTKTLFIVDDIADSFDYQNKYAIIEYFYELQKEPNFYFIFLTHNFDFHRTVSSRLRIDREERLFAEKQQGVISLTKEMYQKNCPLKDWKKRFAKDECVIIACIPFARNLTEYLDLEKDNNLLTQLLHIKKKTKSTKLEHLQRILQRIFKNKKLNLNNNQRKVIDVIYKVADELITQKKDSVQLEHKIALSIAIRLKAEDFMFKRIKNKSIIMEIQKKPFQTPRLIDEFKKVCNDKQVIKIIEKVNLMTPENIHLNSFMYEPILDMSAHHLYTLYEEVRSLENNKTLPQTVIKLINLGL